MKECTTHHHACDCREAAHAAELSALKSRCEDAETLVRAWKKGIVTCELKGVRLCEPLPGKGSNSWWSLYEVEFRDGLPILTPELRDAIRAAVGPL